MIDKKHHHEPSSKWVRAIRDGATVVDSRHVVLFWEHAAYPQYWFPTEDVRLGLLPDDAVRKGDRPELQGLVHVEWDTVDHWLEEAEEVFTHPRDPYSRVDIIQSSRHVVVGLDGTVVAETGQPRILFETGLPPRYYMPLADLRHGLLRTSDRVTHCPYKGAAHYWSVEVDGTVHPDIVWTYRTPLPEAVAVSGFAAFFNERVDLTVDGELQERPATKWSGPG